MNSKKRLLFFDIARITAISGILLLHYCHFYNMPYNNGTPGTIWILNTGKAGNILFIIISGAMLEYTHSAIKNKKDLLAFYYNRFIRIVPAYWMSLIIGVLLFPNLITYSVIRNFRATHGINCVYKFLQSCIKSSCLFYCYHSCSRTALSFYPKTGKYLSRELPFLFCS